MSNKTCKHCGREFSANRARCPHCFPVQRTHACDACGTTVIDRDEVLCAVCKPAPKFTVSTWFERDRAHVCLSDANDVTVAEWWDEDCLSMFEDGFFTRGQAFEVSVIDYARSVGLVPKNATLAR